MTKIQIINGVFGYNTKNGVIPKTPKDEPFDVADDKLVKRLINQKVAVIVEETSPADKEVANTPADNDGPLYTDKTKYDELVAIAQKLGATEEELKPLKSKKAVAELIDKLADKKEDAADEDEDKGSDDNTDDAPDFNDNGVA